MKPAFALSFSENGISLHHWSDDEWFCIGTVPLDAPDLNDRIRALRDQGFALENDLSCKLIIPSDQVRLLSIDTDGLDPQALDQKIRDTLEEATPYALDELTYSTSTEETHTQIVAVAKQTLDEAHDFAADHGFVPQAYIASATGEDALTGPSVDLTPISDDEAAAELLPEEEKTSIPVHPIAASADPDTFRSQVAARTGFDLSQMGLERFAIPAIAAAIFLGLVVGAWSLMRSNPAEEVAAEQVPVDEDQIVSLPPTEAEPEPPAIEDETTPPTDAAILEALKVEPEIVENITPEAAPEDNATLSPTDAAILEALTQDPEQAEDIASAITPETVFREFTGTAPVQPAEFAPLLLLDEDELYLSSIDQTNLSQDAIALPLSESLDTDKPFELAGLPVPSAQSFDLDDRGLVTPSPEGTLNPDGILVFEGKPSKTPPEPPVRFESEPEIEEPDSRLAGLRPRPRPENLVDQFERQQLGGLSRDELAGIRPKLRPKSIEDRPVVDHTPTALAVVRVPRPRTRPNNLLVRAAAKPTAGTAALGSTADVATSSDEAGSFQPKSVSPKIPTTASVARQATIDNAINLRKLNLIGVYGTPANRRALVRLPSGRYKKLKVGDRIDGGNVIAIGDSELRYQKRGKNITLKMPRG